jgi:hypothetical protein
MLTAGVIEPFGAVTVKPVALTPPADTLPFEPLTLKVVVPPEFARLKLPDEREAALLSVFEVADINPVVAKLVPLTCPWEITPPVPAEICPFGPLEMLPPLVIELPEMVPLLVIAPLCIVPVVTTLPLLTENVWPDPLSIFMPFRP